MGCRLNSVFNYSELSKNFEIQEWTFLRFCCLKSWMLQLLVSLKIIPYVTDQSNFYISFIIVLMCYKTVTKNWLLLLLHVLVFLLGKNCFVFTEHSIIILSAFVISLKIAIRTREAVATATTTNYYYYCYYCYSCCCCLCCCYITTHFRVLISWIFVPQIFPSNVTFFQLTVPSSLLASLLTAFIRLFFGFLTFRVPYLFTSKISLGGLDPSNLQICSVHFILLSLVCVEKGWRKSENICEH